MATDSFRNEGFGTARFVHRSGSHSAVAGIVSAQVSESARAHARAAELPRPGIEPGLEVPETSVMSFSLPGQRCSHDPIYHRAQADKPERTTARLDLLTLR